MHDRTNPIGKSVLENLLLVFASILTLTLLAAAAGPGALAGDISGSTDHPLISRFSGSSIIGYQHVNFDDYLLPLGPTENRENGGSTNWVLTNSKRVEGKLTRILYDVPPPHSSLEVFRNYQHALATAGFENLYQCGYRDEPRVKGGCGWAFFNTPTFAKPLHDFEYDGSTNVHYLAAALENENGKIYVSLAVFVSAPSVHSGHVWVEQDIIEEAPLKTGQVVASAETLRRDVARAGHAVVPGIYFDTGTATLRPESMASLGEIAKFLNAHPRINVVVVGHTDNQGGLDFNLALSDKRARAVKDALVKSYGIDRKRLATAGVGYLAPVAPNDTEEGRAKNRRVELVKR